MDERTVNATVSYREQLTPELFIIRVTPDNAEGLNFEPGQYAELAIPEAAPAEGTPGAKAKFVRRPYSIASAPGVGYLEFFIVMVPDGALTPKLCKQETGQRVWLGPKIKGKFTLQEVPTGKDLILIATGTGLAPFISMVRHYKESPRWNRVIIIHCARLAADLGYKAELEGLAAHDNRFFYIPTVTREPAGSDWNGLRGRVQTLFESGKLTELTGVEISPESCQVMMCGNPEMIDSVQAVLETKGLKQHSKKNPGQIHFERFW